MQTTLRIDDQLYREAKAAAAREGVTITRYIETALQLKLKQKALRK
jgi:predicted HicB family RNase H-like nuclease